MEWTGEQRGRKSALKNVILQGFATLDEIEKAVLEHNANLPTEEREDMRRDLGRFKSFYLETEDSQNLLANMVEERQDY